jgi:hypothetical protein
MSKGMYCSASHWMDSASSASVMDGSWIFLMITEWPDSEPPKPGFLMLFSAISRDRASTTSDESMIAPSTIASGERFAIAAWRS